MPSTENLLWESLWTSRNTRYASNEKRFHTLQLIPERKRSGNLEIKSLSSIAKALEVVVCGFMGPEIRSKRDCVPQRRTERCLQKKQPSLLAQ